MFTCSAADAMRIILSFSDINVIIGIIRDGSYNPVAKQSMVNY